jgi:hypothetical protein
MAYGKTPGVEIGLGDLSNQRAIRETYGINHWICASGPNAGNHIANATLSAAGTARTIVTSGGNTTVTVLAAGLDSQVQEGCPRRLTYTFTDAGGADLAGTLHITGLNLFGDPVKKSYAFAAGSLSATTETFFSHVLEVQVVCAAGVVATGADQFSLVATNHVGFGPVDPNIEIANAARIDVVRSVHQVIDSTGVAVQQTFSANNGAPGANTWQLDNISADGEASITLNGADDYDGDFRYHIMFRARNGQAL